MSCLYKALVLYLSVFIAICEAQEKKDYEVPNPTVEALYPRGFQLTLKDDGYTLLGFRGNINEELPGLRGGNIHEDVTSHKGNQWVYKNRDTVLKVGDTIFYWIVVIKNGELYYNSDLEYTVTGFVNADGTPASAQAQIPPSQPTSQPPSQPTTQDTSIHFGEEDNPESRFSVNMTTDCVISKTIIEGKTNICKDEVVFSEEFTKTSLGALDKWDALFQFPGEPDYPFNVYISDKAMSFEEGSLVIAPVLTEFQYGEGFVHSTLNLDTRCTGQANTPECVRVAAGAQIVPPVITAKITTKNNFNFMFGRVEVRAKLPSGSWLVPEINLESSNNPYGPNNYESGLMRVAFVRGNSGLAKKLYGGPVLAESEPFRSALLKEKIGIANWHKDFHNYTMIWRPDGLDFLVDGEPYGTVNPNGGFFEAAKKNNVAHASHWEKGTVMAPLDEKFHITLGLRVGGVNDFSDDVEGKPWKNAGSKAMLDFWRSKDSWQQSWFEASLRVDYVRVYAL